MFSSRAFVYFGLQKATGFRSLHDVVIVSGARTPIGQFNGALKSFSAPALGTIAVKEAVKRSGLEPKEVYMGQVVQSGSLQAPTRQVALNAGLPVSVECTTINKLCASGLKSVSLAAQTIQLDPDNVIVAGGMESMSQAPFFLPRAMPTYGGQMLLDSILTDGLMCAFNKIHMGACAEQLAARYKVTRQQQDEYAIRSYELALKAQKDGLFKDEIVPVEVKTKKGTTVVDEDECPKVYTPEKFPTMRAAFIKDGTITAANASKLNDAGAALVLTSSTKAAASNVKALAKVLSYADGATYPVDFGVAPAFSMRTALARAKLTVDQIDLFEINEAFSAVPLVNIIELGLNPAKVNIHGGAVSLGHPIGMSGARIVIHLVSALKEGQIGMASICNGGGGSTSMIIQKL